MGIRHLGIIIDGNRRLAQRLMLQPWKGHELGARKVEKLLNWCSEAGIKEVTFYAFSLQNFKRPKLEFDYLMNLFVREFNGLSQRVDELREKGLRIRFIGRRELFPKEVQTSMNKLEALTKDHSKLTAYFAMAYGGREEVIDAIKKIALRAKTNGLTPDKIDEKFVMESLYLPSEPDLVIRTGGEHRLSNFLPLQTIYSELIFLDKMWPEFEKEDFLECVAEFERRDRRFGR